MAPLIDEAFERRALLRLLVLRERGRPRRTLVWLRIDRPRQLPAVALQKMLPVVAGDELAAATLAVALCAAVPVMMSAQNASRGGG